MSAKKIQPLLALAWSREDQGGCDLQGSLQIMAIFLWPFSIRAEKASAASGWLC